MKSIKWFNEARFGMFVHWGLYSLLGVGEWAMYRDRTPPEEYAKLADRFNPELFDPDAWCLLAKTAGMKYLVFTTRHHEGFCMYDSKVSDFTSVKTAARRDFVAEIIESCRRHNLKVGLYYSLGDWRFGLPRETDSQEGAEQMVAQAHAQVRELMTCYGKIDILWYDGGYCYPSLWDDGVKQVANFWRADELNRMVYELQPSILINNRSGRPCDFGTPEGEVNTSNEKNRAWETCMTMSDNANSYWGYLKHDPLTKTTAQIINTMVLAACSGGNFLLNVSPAPDGQIPQSQVSRLKEIGEWMNVNGKAIYASHPHKYRRPAGPGGGSAGECSENANSLYFHVLRWSGDEIVIPYEKRRIISAKIMRTGASVRIRQDGDGRVILSGLPEEPPDIVDSIIEMEIEPEQTELQI